MGKKMETEVGNGDGIVCRLRIGLPVTVPADQSPKTCNVFCGGAAPVVGPRMAGLANFCFCASPSKPTAEYAPCT